MVVADPTLTDPESVRLATLTVLRGWALRHDLPTQRAQLLAAAWRAGNRNVRELATLAQVSRTTIYADLRSHGIDHRVRAAPVQAPRPAPLDHDDVRDLAETLAARLLPSMVGEHPEPLAAAAWQCQIALQRIADALDLGSSRPEGGADPLADLAARGSDVTRYAHRALAAHLTGAQLGARQFDSDVTALDLGEPAITGAVLTVVLPNDTSAAIVLRLDQGTPTTGWSWHSDHPAVHDPAGPDDQIAARLDIAAAVVALAGALTPSITLDGDTGDA